ncbi:MAG: hypothetical protein FWF59_09385 [Turicibacter sp.]|nr:hypothetical protein [Turicibacter sp.]
MFKKGVLAAILLSAFVIGMALGSSPGSVPSIQSAQSTPPQPMTQLEQAIQLYETAVREGGEFVPYSQQVRAPSMPGMGENAVGRLGQGIGSFLQTLVREILRTIVVFIDQLISS